MTTRHMHYTCGCEYVGDLASRSCPYHPSHPAIESAPAEPTPPHTGWGVGNLRDCHCLNCQGEPTPEPCRCEIYQSCEKCRKTDPVVFGAEQPTGEPAPCVWRDVGDALFFISAPGCGTKHKHAWPYRSIVGWSHCPYCGHPLQVER